jgi:hypothetical protein
MATRRWQDWINLGLGLWLFLSPWVLAYAGTIGAWNAYAVGVAIVVFAALAAYMPQAWEEVVNSILGFWLILSPFVLGFSGAAAVALHTVIMGLLITAFALWAMFSEPALYERWLRRHST